MRIEALLGLALLTGLLATGCPSKKPMEGANSNDPRAVLRVEGMT